MDPSQAIGTTPSRVNDSILRDPTQGQKQYHLGQREPAVRPERPRRNEFLRSGLRIKIAPLRSTRHRSYNESEHESGTALGIGNPPTI
ncbi:hypothetical protein F2Q69_00046370 [Brassica cretica]|uniref:Uncharacterized protein n=1 Tax=Brassica cretica TaxID=69181 RepID=A0A8S9Q932_BRACR|nr:hypothetical protein F2Q69_00046370 [Brassica cretica]